jgi:glucose-1-phosphate adenylyltransferase
VYGAVYRSVLFAGVTVSEGALIEDSVVMPGAVIGRNAIVRRAIVGENTVVGEGCLVGESGDSEIALVASNTTLPDGFVVKQGEQIGPDEVQEREAQAE